MISLPRVGAMIKRYFLGLMHSYDRLGDMFYWPIIDLILWGFTGLYLVQQVKNPHALTIMLTGLIFWTVIWRTQYEITVNLLSEFWDRNLVNIFASPLTVWEWIAALMSIGFAKLIISFTFAVGLAFFLYQFNIFLYGLWVIPIVLSLAITGWSMGFLVAGILIRFGQKFQQLAWAGAFLIAPFSAPYYSLSILPEWAQTVALFIPASYIFEGIREVILLRKFPVEKLAISFGLNILYLMLAILFFVFMFNKSKELGLGRLI